MKRSIISMTTAILALALLQGCQGKVDPEFMTSQNFGLRVRDEAVFKYDPLNWQVAFNRKRCEFRVHTDNMSDYYCVRLDCVPTAEKQRAKGSIEWTSKSSVNSHKDLVFIVERVDNTGRIWLWSKKERIGAVVQVLD